MQPRIVPVDQRIGRIAQRAHGVVAYAELRAAKVTVAEIRTRRERGSLVEVFRGVYRVGHSADSTEASYMAATKAGRDGAVVAHRAAAHLMGLMRGRTPPPEVFAPKNRRIKGVKTRRIKLHPSERWTYNRIPCTTPARTLLDLAATLDPPTLSRAVHEAQIRFNTTPRQVEAVLARHPRAPGAGKLRRIVTGETPTTLSDLEEAFIKLLKKHKLPLPATNKSADSYLVDCRWPEHELTVELDSYSFHNSRHAWERDRAREREAYARGDQFRRYTYADVCETPAQMLTELQALLPS